MLAIDIFQSLWRGAVLAAVLMVVGILILRSRQKRRIQALAPGADLQTMVYAYPEAALSWFQRHPCWVIGDDQRQPDEDYLGPILVQRRGEPIDLRVFGRRPECEESIQAFRMSLLEAMQGR